MADPIQEDDGLISQDDIDKLLASAGPDESEELSQEDINRLLGSGKDNLPEPDEDFEDDDDLELISQDDIDQLMNSSMDTGDDSLMGPVDSPLSTPGAQKEKDPYRIDASEALAVADCLITQKTLDDLLGGDEALSAPEPVLPDDMPSDAPDDIRKPSSDTVVLDLEDNPEEVSQDDIDALLMGSDDEETDEDAEEDDILISQEDIDTLLMAADQEDEDVLGDLMDREPPADLDEDPLEDADMAVMGGGDEDQVVLRDDDETGLGPAPDSALRGMPWYRSRLVMAGAALLVMLGITVPAVYFLFFTGGQIPHQPETTVTMAVDPMSRPVETPLDEPMDRPVDQPSARTPSDMGTGSKANTAGPPDINLPKIKRTPGNMVLEDFFILMPESVKSMTYVRADLSIDYGDQDVFQEIQDRLPFYRDLIYEAMRSGLVSEPQDQMSEDRLLSMVESALKKALPGDGISRVRFKSFTFS